MGEADLIYDGPWNDVCVLHLQAWAIIMKVHGEPLLPMYTVRWTEYCINYLKNVVKNYDINND